jgi:uncharacterized lipoprotein YmbA
MRSVTSILPALILLSTGCFGTSPPSRFFVLSPSPAGASAVPSTGPDGALGIMPTRVAAYLDGPQIVIFQGNNEVALDEYNRWAEPISAGVSRVIAQNLSALLPTWRVLPQPWDPIVPLRARVLVEITALGWNKAGEARLEGNWAVVVGQADLAVARGRVVLRRDIAGSGPDAGVAATSTLLDEMAREIAIAVRALPPAR